MATIKPIEGRTIHQIQSGQVIVDLCSAAKELVENSIDSGATSIEVRFKNQGLDSIEVQDNGSGITPQNYETLALKHHTSKLSTYSDLTTLQTFGFRGEALSSLCALSHFTVTTCLAEDAPKGTKLEFETSGKLKNTSVVAAQKGTTVNVENLFQNLPVRRRELERNIKREWNRVVSLLGQYACIQTGIKISVTQQQPKGKKNILFSTKGNLSTRENIVNVFGAKTLTVLLKLDLKLEIEPTSGSNYRWNTQDDEETKEIRIVGHISRPAFGEGRQTPDRQMFFVNSRPCSLPQVSKAFNEVYKSYNSSQSPFIFANIEMDTHLYDVNVSPDKRTILLHDQTRMLDQLKTSLTELFEVQDHTVPISQLLAQKQPLYKQLTIARPDVIPIPTSQIPESSAETEEASDDEGQAADTDKELTQDAPLVTGKTRTDQARVSRESLKRDQEAVSLISRKIEDRNAKHDAKSKADVEKSFDFPKKVLKSTEESDKKDKEARLGGNPSSNSEEADDEVIAAENSSMHTLGSKDDNISLQQTNNTASSGLKVTESEESIPAVATPIRRAYPSVTGVSPSIVRSSRSPATMATITIGNFKVISPVGSPAKRPRIDIIRGNSTGQTSLPSFGNRLSQRFAATNGIANKSARDGNVIAMEDVEEDETSSAVDGDESLPDTHQSEESADEKASTNQISDTGASLELFQPPKSTDVLDGDYVDEAEKKSQEDAKVLRMIKAAEEEAARLSEDNIKRARLLLKHGSKRKDAVVHLVQSLAITPERVSNQLRNVKEALRAYKVDKSVPIANEEALDAQSAEERLSLTVQKSDFSKMKIIGQFNLGFILASRSVVSAAASPDALSATNDLFIIDQHASDEKYNFERLQATTIVQSQRLVQPKTLDLTAVEEEIVIENRAALETNGFVVTVDESGCSPVGQRCQLVSLPLSRETTFSLIDLEELLALLAEHPGGSTAAAAVPRPSKVRKMFAMRACRSSIMIGKTLTHRQMGIVVRHMGEIERPWNCPHGRPTMRHLYNLGVWDEVGWREGDGVDGGRAGPTDWAAYVRQEREV